MGPASERRRVDESTLSFDAVALQDRCLGPLEGPSCVRSHSGLLPLCGLRYVNHMTSLRNVK